MRRQWPTFQISVVLPGSGPCRDDDPSAAGTVKRDVPPTRITRSPGSSAVTTCKPMHPEPAVPKEKRECVWRWLYRRAEGEYFVHMLFSDRDLHVDGFARLLEA